MYFVSFLGEEPKIRKCKKTGSSEKAALVGQTERWVFASKCRASHCRVVSTIELSLMFQPKHQYQRIFFSLTEGCSYKKVFAASSASRRVSKWPTLGRIVLPPVQTAPPAQTTDQSRGDRKNLSPKYTFRIFHRQPDAPFIVFGQVVDPSHLPRCNTKVKKKCRSNG